MRPMERQVPRVPRLSEQIGPKAVDVGHFEDHRSAWPRHGGDPVAESRSIVIMFKNVHRKHDVEASLERVELIERDIGQVAKIGRRGRMEITAGDARLRRHLAHAVSEQSAAAGEIEDPYWPGFHTRIPKQLPSLPAEGDGFDRPTDALGLRLKILALAVFIKERDLGERRHGDVNSATAAAKNLDSAHLPALVVELSERGEIAPITCGAGAIYCN
jgi:hypothetical protein